MGSANVRIGEVLPAGAGTEARACGVATPRCLCGPAARPVRFCEINGFPAVRCAGCGLIYLQPQPTTEDLNRYYEGYHTGHASQSVGDDQWFLASEGERELFARIVRLAKNFGPGKRFLDVGCSYGHLVSAGLAAGLDAHGVEPFEEPFRFAQQQLGSRVRQSGLDGCGHAEGSFDVIALANVFEHLPSPIDALREIHRLLSPGGAVILIVPNIWPFLPLVTWNVTLRRRQSLVSRLAVFDAPFHLYYFTPGGLRRLCEESGFQVVAEENAPVISNRSRLKTAVKRTYKIAADVLRLATWSRVIVGHSLLVVATKKPRA